MSIEQYIFHNIIHNDVMNFMIYSSCQTLKRSYHKIMKTGYDWFCFQTLDVLHNTFLNIYQ